MTEQERLLEKQEETLKKMQKFSVKTSAKKVRTTNTLLRLLVIILILLILLMSISWACARFVNSTGFTVSLDKDADGLSLFDNANDMNPTTRLSAAPVEDMWNISVDWLPEKVDEEGFGSHNGDADKDGAIDYIAYTFLLSNSTDKTITYDSIIKVDSQEKDADEALRVRVIREGESADYAKVAKDGSKEKEAADYSWVDPVTVMKETSAQVKSGEKIKYTIVIWLEGEDPECVNEIMGGEVKLSMDFSVVDNEAGNGELV